MPQGRKVQRITDGVATQRGTPAVVAHSGAESQGLPGGAPQAAPVLAGKDVPRLLVVGIDPSATGTALMALDAATGELVQSLRISTKLTGVNRLIHIRKEIANYFARMALAGTVTHVCIEGYSYGSQASQAHKLGEVGGIVKLGVSALRGLAAYPTIIPPQKLKKYALGDGSAKKEKMILGVYKKWGVEYKTNDEVDAYALARLAQALVLGEAHFKYELEALTEKIEPFTEMPAGPLFDALNTLPTLRLVAA
jgi:crossover junction endodeoxyribonuclease RuvC